MSLRSVLVAHSVSPGADRFHDSPEISTLYIRNEISTSCVHDSVKISGGSLCEDLHAVRLDGKLVATTRAELRLCRVSGRLRLPPASRSRPTTRHTYMEDRCMLLP